MGEFLQDVFPILFIFIVLFGYIIYHFINFKIYSNSSYYEKTNNSYFSTLFDAGIQGEYKVSQKVQNLEFEGCKVLFNLYIPTKNGKTTEIDVLLISNFGLFVIESKNYSGWIFGNDYQKYWTQTLPAGRYGINKEKFYNPVKQNYYHLVSLRNFLKTTVPFYSLIVFSDHCEFKNVQVNQRNTKVIHNYQLKKTINNIRNSETKSYLSLEQIENMYQRLIPYSQVDSSVKYQHIQNIRKNF